MVELPDLAYAVALAELPAMGPKRLRALLTDRKAADAFELIKSRRVRLDRDVAAAICKRAAPVMDDWIEAIGHVDVAARWQRYQAAGIGVAAMWSPAFPDALTADPEPPALLFHQGDLAAVGGARVAIIGTRRCTQYGRDVAAEFGAGLAAAGVAVVSGLAAGIDAAAHRGALSVDGAAPVAVVGSGLDVVYPRTNTKLWGQVAQRGVILSEAPLGAMPERWRFPARNRIIAGLADVVVVVESHEKGGSLLTVADAIERDRPVLAVPGPVRSAASVGTNGLLADGCQPACSVDDVLLALGLAPDARRSCADLRPAPTAAQQSVLDAVGWQPASLDQVVLRSGLPVGDAASGVESLIAAGWLARVDGWLERVANA